MHAQAAGALRRIDTEAHLLADGGVTFVVRQKLGSGSISRGAEPQAPKPADPFAQPEPDLFVADLTPTHFALLNKYNVLERHLLVITRADIDQEVPLDFADFEALALCMAGPPVLGFYNGGSGAGASQRHKHLQVVRLPLSPRDEIPIESLIAGDATRGLPFRHAFTRIDTSGDAPTRAQRLLSAYHALRAQAGAGGEPYNLLVARDWMLFVPRRQPTFASIPVNALAFAGALFVHDEDERRSVERIGPLAVLRGVAFPKDPT